MANDDYCVGIDLGTSYSCVSVFRHGKVEVIPNSEGNYIVPSWVAFTDTERLIGEPAKNQAASNPQSDCPRRRMECLETLKAGSLTASCSMRRAGRRARPAAR